LISMPAIAINSLDDPRLEAYRNLKDTNTTRREGLFVAEGLKLARRLVESDVELVSLLLTERYLEQFADLPPKVPVFVVSDEWIETIVGFNFHRGVLACGKRGPAVSIDILAVSLGERATIAVCPDVQDPDNLGVILRIASAFGIDAVLLGDRTADPFSRRVLRVSMGAAFRVPVLTAQDLAADLNHLHAHYAFERWATVLDADAVPLGELTRSPRLALLFGSEGHGLERPLIEQCERRVRIPMTPGVDSLNVAVAAGIFFYEAMQR
jgi:tRNA G18 (ribose-2'-O)-methylase SpoU